MALARARQTAAALAAVVAGATLAACGAHGGTARSAPAALRPGTSAPATPSASPSATPQGPRSQPPATSSSPPASSPPASATPSTSLPPASGSPGGGPTPATPGPPAPGSPPQSAGGAGEAAVSPSLEYALPGGSGAAVALTFDDGPDPRWTPRILALLAQHHAKATFCEIGPNAQRYPYLVEQITAAGDRLCDHSVHHDEQQSRKPTAYNVSEITGAQQEISAAAGPDGKLWYYRAPGGDFSPQIRGIAAQHGLRPLGWTVDSNDWRRPGVDTIMRDIGKDLRPGAIILMHDGGGDRSQTVEALARLLDRLDAEGYTYAFPAR